MTTNLIELPEGKTPHTFKAQLVEITDMGPDFSITRMPMPTVGTSSKSAGVQALKGSVTIKGKLTVEYEIPMYDADGVDLSKAKCYTSA